MKKWLISFTVLAFAASSFAVSTSESANSSAFMDEPSDLPSTPPTINKDSLQAVWAAWAAKRDSLQQLWQQKMEAERAKMDSIMTANQAMWTKERQEALAEQQKIINGFKAGTISRDSLEKLIAHRRIVADSLWKLAIERFQQFHNQERARIDSARAECKTRFADREKEKKGGIDVALTKIADAIKNLEAKQATVTDQARLDAIKTAIKRLEEIQAKLQAAQNK